MTTYCLPPTDTCWASRSRLRAARLPQDLPGLLVERAEFLVLRRADEHEAAGGHDRSAVILGPRLRASALHQLGQLAKRHLPCDFALVEVDGIERAPRRFHRRVAVGIEEPVIARRRVGNVGGASSGSLRDVAVGLSPKRNATSALRSWLESAGKAGIRPRPTRNRLVHRFTRQPLTDCRDVRDVARAVAFSSAPWHDHAVGLVNALTDCGGRRLLRAVDLDHRQDPRHLVAVHVEPSR